MRRKNAAWQQNCSGCYHGRVMARTALISPANSTEHRDKIPVTELLNCLIDNGLRKLNPPLNQNEIRSIEICLNKALPNLSHQVLDATVRELPPRLSIVRPEAA